MDKIGKGIVQVQQKEQQNLSEKQASYEEIGKNLKDVSIDNIEVDTNQEETIKKPKKKLTSKQTIFRNFSYPGRFILTIYSFYSIMIVIGIILQYILIIGGILFILESTFAIILFSLVFILFCLLISNALIIPLWEFSNFPYMTIYNYWSNIINVWKTILNKDLDKQMEFIEDIPSVLAFLLSIIYVFIMLFFYGDSGATFDVINLITNIFTLIHLLFYYVSYWISCLKFCIFFVKGKDFNTKLARQETTDITILQHVELCKSEKSGSLNTGVFGSLKEQIFLKYWHYHFYNKLIISFILFIVFIVLGITKTQDGLSAISLAIWFLIFTPICIAISFPMFFNDENKSKCLCKKRWFDFEQNEEIAKRNKKKKILTLITLRIICNGFLILVGIGFVFIFLFIGKEGTSGMYTFKDTNVPKNEDDPDLSVSISSPMCYSSIHGLKFHQIIALINDAYYWDNEKEIKTNLTTENNGNKTQSNFSKWYTQLFFDKNLERVIPHGELIYENYLKYHNQIKKEIEEKKDKNKTPEEDETKEKGKEFEESFKFKSHSKIVHYTVQTKEGFNVTVLSIKGTDSRGDVFVDAQLFLPSALLTLAHRLLPLVNDQNSYTAIYLEYSLTLPFRTLKDFTVIDQYIKELKEVITDLPLNERTIVTGHSLGGGLSKIVAKILGKNSISLSGPGISMTSNIYDPPNFNRNFYSSFIDIIPDLDIVPRVERSGGAIYRLNCRAGSLACHNSERSLCTSLITCRVPDYKEYCLKVGFSEEEIESIIKLTDN